MIETDLLIIGSGFAGLWAAIAARDAGVARVTLVDKGAIGMSSQSKMSAGATIHCLPEDDPDLWLRDITEAQGFLCHQDMVADMLATSSARLRRLESWGVRYERNPGGEGHLRLPSRGFQHARMMVLPARRERIGGSAVVTTLQRQVARRRVRRHSRLLITELLQRHGRVAGAVGIDRTTGAPAVFTARAVVLAAGDCSFRGNYVGTDAATGDAFRLAYDAGVRLSNMEFLCVNTGSPRYGFEGTGVVLRFGGRLINAKGEAFMPRYHPEGDAAETNFLTQGMIKEVQQGNGPPFFLDLGGTNKDFLRSMFARFGGFMPLNLERLRELGTDIYEKPQEWLPAVQTLRGGIRTGIECQSDLPGLFAAGLSQAFDPGLFNGWSSMRAMWSGERAGMETAAFLARAGDVVIDADRVAGARQDAMAPLGRRAGVAPDEVLDRLQRALFPYGVCVLKTAERLLSALRAVEELRDAAVPVLCAADAHELAKAHETANMVRVAEMFLRASLARTESRGDHFREDYPERDNRAWLKWVNLRRESDGAMVVEKEPVPFDRYPLQPPTDAGR